MINFCFLQGFKASIIVVPMACAIYILCVLQISKQVKEWKKIQEMKQMAT